MTKVYCYDEYLLKDFIKFCSDKHKAALVEFPEEFTQNQYANYRFVNNSWLIEEFLAYCEDEE